MKYDTLPTIGIRPTIDGRRLGVRESLEDQTMNMAKAAAALIEANVKHANGQPVKPTPASEDRQRQRRPTRSSARTM